MSADGLNGHGYARSERVRGALAAMPAHDVIDEFRAAMRARGLIPPDKIQADGHMHRCDVEGKRGKGDGAYVLYMDGIPAGGFQNWKDGLDWEKWCYKDAESLTPEERASLSVIWERVRKEREAEQQRRHAEAAERAQEIWTEAEPVEDTTRHPYLVSKRVKGAGLRLYRGRLVIPMYNDLGELSSLQFIAADADGTKRFLTGGKTKGCSFTIGEPDGVLCIAEGYATGASIHEATGCAVAVAFNAGNLVAVARGLRKTFPKLRLIVCADDDAKTEGNPGLTKAREAAQAVGGLLAVPDFGAERSEGATDCNDLHRHAGLEAVRACIERAVLIEQQHEAAQGPGASAPRGEPTPLVRPMPSPAPYPIEALGPILGPAAHAIAEVVQVPEALAANTVLGIAALAAQAYANVETLGGVRPLSLYIATIADSGARKSAADRVAKAPIDERRRRMSIRYREQLAEYEVAASACKLARTQARANAQGQDDYAAALREIKDKPAPRKPWFICSDPTAEGLMRSLADGQYAQGIYTDEGGQFVGGYALSDESELRTVAMLSRVWDGAPLDRVRATDSEHIELYGRRLSMNLLVQPAVATRLFATPLYRAQGFLARLLLSAPDSIAGTRQHKPGPDPYQDSRLRRYYEAIAALLDRDPVEDHEVGGLDPPTLALSLEAGTLLIDAYNEIESAQGPGNALEPISEWASKAAEHACRIAGVLTLVAGGPDATHVLPETMRGALALTEHYLGEYTRLVGVAGISEEIRRAQLLLDWISGKGKRSLTAREVMQSGPNSIRTAKDAHAALHTLVEHGWLCCEGKAYTAHPSALTGSR